MKTIVLVLSVCFLFAACGGNNSEYDKYYDSNKEAVEGETDDGPVSQTKVGDNAGISDMVSDSTVNLQGETLEQGKNMIAMLDCLSCHKEDEKLVGPSYREVAKKYAFNEKNISYLSTKIIEGGSGVWGQVPMTPHPDVSREKARQMASYILSLNKK
jgi:cytochrome c